MLDVILTLLFAYIVVSIVVNALFKGNGCLNMLFLGWLFNRNNRRPPRPPMDGGFGGGFGSPRPPMSRGFRVPRAPRPPMGGFGSPRGGGFGGGSRGGFGGGRGFGGGHSRGGGGGRKF